MCGAPCKQYIVVKTFEYFQLVSTVQDAAKVHSYYVGMVDVGPHFYVLRFVCKKCHKVALALTLSDRLVCTLVPSLLLVA